MNEVLFLLSSVLRDQDFFFCCNSLLRGKNMDSQLISSLVKGAELNYLIALKALSLEIKVCFCPCG